MVACVAERSNGRFVRTCLQENKNVAKKELANLDMSRKKKTSTFTGACYNPFGFFPEISVLNEFQGLNSWNYMAGLSRVSMSAHSLGYFLKSLLN